VVVVVEVLVPDATPVVVVVDDEAVVLVDVEVVVVPEWSEVASSEPVLRSPAAMCDDMAEPPKPPVATSATAAVPRRACRLLQDIDPSSGQRQRAGRPRLDFCLGPYRPSGTSP
jgi:hypothetical protein